MPVWWQSMSLQLRVLENNQISSQHSSNNEGFEMWWQLGFLTLSAYFVEIGAFIESIYSNQSVGK